MISASLQQKMQQKMSPQQIQLMKLLQLPTALLEERIKEEVEKNPTLEEDESTPKEEVASIDEVDKPSSEESDMDFFSNDDEIIIHRNNNDYQGEDNLSFYASKVSFHEDLLSQLSLQDLDQRELMIGQEIIGNIDEAGYLTRPLSSMVDDFLFSQNIEVSEQELEKVLNIIQTFDPSGVGARDLQECLLLQLDRQESIDEIVLARKIVGKYFELFKNRQYSIIAQKVQSTQEQLQAAIDEIVKLNPKPGNSLYSTSSAIESVAIIPDFIVWQQNGKVEFQVNNVNNNNNLHVSSYYQNMLKQLENKTDKASKETISFLKEKLESANVFIDSLLKRKNTLYLIMKNIIDYQKDYFLDGDVRKLKPMRLVDIAQRVDMDISTVSRVVSNKYAQTHFGIFRLKDFFSNFMVNEQGSKISTDTIKNQLYQIIAEEDKSLPLTDDQLAAMLKEEGFPIARRTISKYREALGLPTARLRRKII